MCVCVLVCVRACVLVRMCVMWVGGWVYVVAHAWLCWYYEILKSQFLVHLHWASTMHANSIN